MPKRCALDLVTSVRCLRGRLRASSKAKRWMRSTPARVKTATSVADLDRQPAVRAPADAGVLALGVLADDDPVDVLAVRRAGSSRPGSTRAGPHVGVLVEALADRQAQAPERDVVGHLLAADRAEEDRVEALQLLEPALGDVVPVLQVEVASSRGSARPRRRSRRPCRERLEDFGPAAMTSGPMPSPGMRAILYLRMATRSGGRRRSADNRG